MISQKLASQEKCFPEIDFLGKMNNYCLGEDWLLLSKTHCLATAKQEFINGCCLARLTDWLLLSKAL